MAKGVKIVEKPLYRKAFLHGNKAPDIELSTERLMDSKILEGGACIDQLLRHQQQPI